MIDVTHTRIQKGISFDSGSALWVKRDDESHPTYGGNKVRKLRHLLSDATRRGARRIVTMGAAGSHHVLATTLFARIVGLSTAAVLFPQRRTAHAEEVLRAALASGVVAWPASSLALAPLVLALHVRPGDVVVPAGGSNAVGTRGFVEAAFELERDVRAGAMPEPDVLIVPVGSGGTAAGLAAGLAQTSLRTRVVGVVVVAPPWIARASAVSLVRRVAGAPPSWLRDARGRLSFDASWLGAGYGEPTEAGARATERAAAIGLELEPTYTAKAFAAALAMGEQGAARTLLYWHTLSSAPMAPLGGDAVVIPDRLARLLRA